MIILNDYDTIKSCLYAVLKQWILNNFQIVKLQINSQSRQNSRM